MLAGAVQEIVTLVDEAIATLTTVGASATVAGVTAELACEALEFPREFVATTVNV